MGTRKNRPADRTLRAPMRSPGRPPPGAFAVDDQPGAVSQRCNPQWESGVSNLDRSVAC